MKQKVSPVVAAIVIAAAIVLCVFWIWRGTSSSGDPKQIEDTIRAGLAGGATAGPPPGIMPQGSGPAPVSTNLVPPGVGGAGMGR